MSPKALSSRKVETLPGVGIGCEVASDENP